MNFAEQIARIQSAASDPRQLALAVLEIVLDSKPPELRRALEAAAVLRWFDEDSLGKVLDQDLRARARHWLEMLKRLSAVEPASGRKGWNLHETTRRALREQLQVQRANRIAELARRACEAFQGPSFSERIESAYHLALANPTGCSLVLRSLNFDLQANPEQGLAFAAALREYLTQDIWPAATRGWAAYFAAANRQHYRPIQATLQDAETSLACFEACALEEGIACAGALLGDAHFQRGLTGDADKTLGHYQRSLDVRERVLLANPDSAQAARDVSVSLNKLADFLARRGMPGDADKAFAYYNRDSEISQRLLATNLESAQAARDVSVSLNNLADFLAMRGLPGDAESAFGHYQRGLEVRERLLASNLESAQAARDVSVSLNKLADFLARRGKSGDTDDALGQYERSLKISERLLAANPESAQAARDVSVSLNKLADLLAIRGLSGDADQALGHYRLSLEVRERLLAANPESAQAARDVSLSLNRLADLMARRGLPGDTDKALSHYQRSLAISQRLLAANPESAQAARDVLVNFNKLSDFLTRRGLPGDADKAMGHNQRSLEISERLLVANPDSAQAARDVSVSLIMMADFLARRGLPGDADKALAHYQRSLEVSERLLVANPDSAQATRDVSVSWNKLADFLVRRGLPGDVDTALGHYQRSLEVRERLLVANPDSAQAARDVSVSWNKLADFLARRGFPGDADMALAHYQRSLEVSERLLVANPESAQAARDVSVSIERMAKMRVRQGNAAGALAEQERALGIARKLWEYDSSYEIGRTLAISLLLAGQYAEAAGDASKANRHFAECFALLDKFFRQGAPLDASLRALHTELKSMVSGPQ